MRCAAILIGLPVRRPIPDAWRSLAARNSTTSRRTGANFIASSHVSLCQSLIYWRCSPPYSGKTEYLTASPAPVKLSLKSEFLQRPHCIIPLSSNDFLLSAQKTPK